MRAALLTTAVVLAAIVMFSWDRLDLFGDAPQPDASRSVRTRGLPDVGAARTADTEADLRASNAPADMTAGTQTDDLLASIRTHVVRREDTLWSIALDYYGDDLRARAIYEANRAQIEDPRVLREGQVLILP